MQVFIILAIVSLVVVFSVMKLLQYRKENSGDCEGEWLWTECDKKCSGGDSVRYGTFRTTKEATYNGKCEYKTGDKITEACPASECPPENCEGGEVWLETCEGSCSDDNAILYGKYIVTSEERYLGEKCPYEPDEILIKDCPVNMCPPEDCQGYWEQDEECQEGLCSDDPRPQIGSTYVITKPGAYGGASCEAVNDQEKFDNCPDAKCPAEDCQGGWVQDQACEDGLCSGDPRPQIRSTYRITKPGAYRGEPCEAVNDQEKFDNCPDAKCPAENCEGVWEMGEYCSGPCGDKESPTWPNDSTINAKFVITKQSVNQGASCGAVDGYTTTIPCPDADRCPSEDCTGVFEKLEAPECNSVEEGVACVTDGVYYADKNDTFGLSLIEGWEFVYYKQTGGPHYGGNACPYDDGVVSTQQISSS